MLLAGVEALNSPARSRTLIYFMTHLPNDFPMLRAYEGDDLRAAFEQFTEEAWGDDIQPAIAVWKDNFLVAQVLPVYNPQTGEYEPVLVEIEPP